MFVVRRIARGYGSLFLAESARESKDDRQRTIKALDRRDVLAASGELDRLAASIARHVERFIILSDIDAGRIAAGRIGGPLVFGRRRDLFTNLSLVFMDTTTHAFYGDGGKTLGLSFTTPTLPSAAMLFCSLLALPPPRN